jgi:sec-independent protein translocase protein TatA
MFGLTPAHLVLILIIALIVVGPGKLPEVGAAMGKSIREFQKASSSVQETVATPLAEPAAPMTAPATSQPAVATSQPAVATSQPANPAD